MARFKQDTRRTARRARGEEKGENPGGASWENASEEIVSGLPHVTAPARTCAGESSESGDEVCRSGAKDVDDKRDRKRDIKRCDEIGEDKRRRSNEERYTTQNDTNILKYHQ